MESAKDALGDIYFGKTSLRGADHESLIELIAKSAALAFGSQIGREVDRSVLGSILGKSRTTEKDSVHAPEDRPDNRKDSQRTIRDR